jgi:hypothetical protein
VKTFNGLDEFEQALGTHLGYSDWHTISRPVGRALRGVDR